MATVLLIERFEGLEFDDDMKGQGFTYAEVIDIDHLRAVRKNGRSKVVLIDEVAQWVERECAGEALLATEQDDFMIVFNNPCDAMLYHLRFA